MFRRAVVEIFFSKNNRAEVGRQPVEATFLDRYVLAGEAVIIESNRGARLCAFGFFEGLKRDRSWKSLFAIKGIGR